MIKQLSGKKNINNSLVELLTTYRYLSYWTQNLCIVHFSRLRGAVQNELPLIFFTFCFQGGNLVTR